MKDRKRNTGVTHSNYRKQLPLLVFVHKRKRRVVGARSFSEDPVELRLSPLRRRHSPAGADEPNSQRKAPI